MQSPQVTFSDEVSHHFVPTHNRVGTVSWIHVTQTRTSLIGRFRTSGCMVTLMKAVTTLSRGQMDTLPGSCAIRGDIPVMKVTLKTFRSTPHLS